MNLTKIGQLKFRYTTVLITLGLLCLFALATVCIEFVNAGL